LWLERWGGERIKADNLLFYKIKYSAYLYAWFAQVLDNNYEMQYELDKGTYSVYLFIIYYIYHLIFSVKNKRKVIKPKKERLKSSIDSF